MIGSTIGHYVIEARLGEGGMGVVYRARDTQLDRTVAIKILSADAGPASRAQLVREARTASALSHPHIVTIHSVEEDAGVDFIVMEYAAGMSLATLSPSGLPSETVIDYALQLSSALATAHAAGIVHRDIKPGNVIVTPGGLKVLDFGLARRSAAPDEQTRALVNDATFTAPGVLIGTAGYMPPEHITGGTADAPGDVFGFGVLLYRLIAGRPPFSGATMWQILDATVHADPQPLDVVRPGTPRALVEVVNRCLAKNPGDRYQSGAEVHAALVELRNATTPARGPGRSRLYAAAIAAALVAAAALGAVVWSRVNATRAAWVVSAAAEIRRRADSGDWAGAYRLTREAAARAPNDPQIRQAARVSTMATPVRTNPDGALVEMRAYNGADDRWLAIGRAPIAAATGAPAGQVRWRISKEGYETLEASPSAPPYEFTLAPAKEIPSGMVFVPGGEFSLESTGQTVKLPDFWIDRFEVTNRAFKQFVDAGGYEKREYWATPFIADGRTIDWPEAMSRFRDTTGRAGPSTWELGAYPDGQADYPVGGVNWYEAAAYATFAGKSLPTAYHWYYASGAFGIFSSIVGFSNFGGKGPAAVGFFKGLGPYGTYDMAGNVKEWCWNETDRRWRYVLGGGYNEATYQFRDQDARPPMERGASFGFRLMKQATPFEPTHLQAINSFERDPGTLRPVADAVFDAYRNLYNYDQIPLASALVSEEHDANWVRQRVTFTAAYGSERVPAVVFVPSLAKPPYQAIVYFPGSDAVVSRTSQTMFVQWIEFLVRSGRMVIFPIYQNTYERRSDRPRGPNGVREIQIQRALDVRRAVDYLQSRPDVDGTKIAGYGLSLGAQLMPVFLAIEPRLRTGVLLSGGFETWTIPPEADPVNFAPRVKQPVLMVNGRDDFDLPYASAQVPLFKMLGTAAADKRHAVLEGGHLPPQPQPVYKEILDWLDRYLGPVEFAAR